MNFGQWLGLGTLVVSLYILWEIRQLLLLLFVAVVFVIALNRLVRQLQRLGLKRGLASLISVIGLLAITALFIGLVVPPFLSQFRQLTQLVPQGLIMLEIGINQLSVSLPEEARQFFPNVGELSNQLQPLLTSLANNFFRLFSGFLNIAGSSLLVIVISIMLLLNPQPYRQGFLRLFPSFYRRRADQIFTMCETDLVAWILGTLFNMVVIGCVSGLVLWGLGVKLVLANALLAGFLEAVPNVGPVLSTIAPAAISFLDSPWKSVAVIVAYLLIQQLEQFLLVPIVMGQQISLLPAVTLIAQIFFASFFGFLGLFLALPLLIIVRILLREILVKDVLDQWRENAEEESPEELPEISFSDAESSVTVNI